MKILESQNAVLTNFEVYQHLINEQHKFKEPDRRKKVPRSVQSIVKDVSIRICEAVCCYGCNEILIYD